MNNTEDEIDNILKVFVDTIEADISEKKRLAKSFAGDERYISAGGEQTDMCCLMKTSKYIKTCTADAKIKLLELFKESGKQ